MKMKEQKNPDTIVKEAQKDAKLETKKDESNKMNKSEMKAESKKENLVNKQQKEELKADKNLESPLMSEKFKKAFETFKANWKEVSIENENK